MRSVMTSGLKKFATDWSLVRALIVSLCLLVSGCKLDLYTNLTERDANQMLAILMANGVNALKEYTADTGVVLRVEEAELAHAIDILSANGFPQEQRDSIGKVFEKSGIMSSPFEERVRYIYALGDDISATLSAIDGVLMARVHIVLPENSGLNDDIKPSSAAVFIKHRRGVDLDFFTPQIRRLVSNAIEGVEYESVTVVLVEAEPPQLLVDQARIPVSELFFGLGVRTTDVQHFWEIIVGVAIVVTLLVLSNLFLLSSLLRNGGFRKAARGDDDLQPDLAE